MFNRRSLAIGLLGTTALTVGGCASLVGTVSTAVSFAEAAAAGALALVPDLQAVGVPQAVLDIVNTAANSLSSAASALATSLSKTASEGIYKQISAAVLAIAAAVAPLTGLPGIVVTVLSALSAVVPGIAQALGIVGVSAVRPAMSAPRAAALLSAYAKTK